MNLLARLSVRHSVALFAAIALVAIAFLGALTLNAMRHAGNIAQHVLADVKLTRAASVVDMLHDGLRGDVLNSRLAGAGVDASRREALRKEAAGHGESILKAWQTLEAEARDETLRRQLAEVKPVLVAYVDSSRALVEACLADIDSEDQQLDFDTAFGQLEGALAKVSHRIEATADGTVAEQEAVFRRDRWVFLAAMAVALAAMAAFGWLFVRSTLQRLGAEPAELRDFTVRIAGGDLDAGFAGQPPAASVAGTMLRMREQLAGLVTEVRRNADSVATASTQIAHGSMDLSARTEEQASALQQAAASMDQLGGTVAHNADTARQADTLARRASEVAQRGGATVGEVVQTMHGIGQAAGRIADIIGVVDGIAFQTNILALNAAVEAARAGEEGRGFAVVASEVRVLAQRAAGAAKEIKSLIGACRDRVEAGNALVADAGTTMNELVDAVREVSSLMAQISAASAEQRQGVGQVSEAVSQIDQNTQRNAALVEESAAAADTLKQQADALVAAVSAFRVRATAAVARPTPAPATPLRPALAAAEGDWQRY